METPAFVVIPTKGNRLDTLERAVNAAGSQIGNYVVIVHNSDEIPHVDTSFPVATLKVDPNRPVNLSHMWNVGLEFVAELVFQRFKANAHYNVAIINDDTILPDGWFEGVGAGMRTQGAAAACSGPENHLHRHAVAVPLHTRMQGFAFMLAGEWEQRADERFWWWYGDDDMDWTARQLGGMAMIQGWPVKHLYPNGQFTPELHARTALDALAFVNKWGKRPW